MPSFLVTAIDALKYPYLANFAFGSYYLKYQDQHYTSIDVIGLCSSNDATNMLPFRHEDRKYQLSIQYVWAYVNEV